MYAAFRRGSHADVVRVHRVPEVTEGGYSDFAPSLCGVIPGPRAWAEVAALPAPDASFPYAHRCNDCFPEVN